MANKEGIQIFGRLVSATSEHILAHADEILVEEATESKPAVTVQDRLDSMPTLDENISMLAINQWPRTVIKSITPGLSNVDGELYITPPFAEDDPDIVLAVKVNNTRYNVGTPSEHIVYTARDTRKQYLWNGESFVEVAGSSSGSGQANDAGDIFNEYDKHRYRVWVGSQEDFDLLSRTEDDVIYFVGVGTGHEPEPSATDKYTISWELTHCRFENELIRSVDSGDSYSNTIIPDEGYEISAESVVVTMVGTGTLSDAFSPEDNSVTIDAVAGNVRITATAIAALESITVVPSPTGFEHNKINLYAQLNPIFADFVGNDTLIWSINNRLDFVLNQSTGAVAELELVGRSLGGSNVRVTCTSTYWNISGYIDLENVVWTEPHGTGGDDPTQWEPTVDPTNPDSVAIAAFYTGQNTMTVETAVGGTVVNDVSYQIKEPAPTLRRYENGILSYIPAVTLGQGGTLTYKRSCSVTLQAVRNDSVIGEQLIEISSKNNTHDDYIYFEDATVEEIFKASYYGGSSNTGVTFNTAATNQYSGNDDGFKLIMKSAKKEQIKYLNELEFFKGHFISIQGCTNLAEVRLQRLNSSVRNWNVFCNGYGISGTGLTDVEIPETCVEYNMAIQNPNYNSIGGAAISGPLSSLTFPATFTTITSSIKAISGITELDLSNTGLSTMCKQTFYDLPDLETVKFPGSLEEIKNGQVFRNCPKVRRIEFGAGFKQCNVSSLLYQSGDSGGVTLVFYGTDDNIPTKFILGDETNNKVTSILVPSGTDDDYLGIFKNVNNQTIDVSDRIHEMPQQQSEESGDD